jgi:hypothetical protein
MLVEGMVLTHINGVDQQGLAYDAVRGALSVRPCELRFAVSTAAAQAGELTAQRASQKNNTDLHL